MKRELIHNRRKKEHAFVKWCRKNKAMNKRIKCRRKYRYMGSEGKE